MLIYAQPLEVIIFQLKCLWVKHKVHQLVKSFLKKRAFIVSIMFFVIIVFKFILFMSLITKGVSVVLAPTLVPTTALSS